MVALFGTIGTLFGTIGTIAFGRIILGRIFPFVSVAVVATGLRHANADVGPALSSNAPLSSPSACPKKIIPSFAVQLTIRSRNRIRAAGSR